MEQIITLTPISSLEKVFIGGQFKQSTDEFSCLENEILSLQVAFNYEVKENNWDGKQIYFTAEGSLAKFVSFREVRHVPGQTLVLYGCDDNYECTTPGLFPDPLMEVSEYGISVRTITGMQSVWVYISPLDNEKIPAGNHKITIKALDYFNNDYLGECSINVNVVAKSLPTQVIDYTCWIYCDCISLQHNVEMFSDEFYKYLKSYVTIANKFGMNMILTPIFTPPLEIAPGGERVTAQLINVTYIDEKYTFNFDEFDKWVQICSDCGIEKFEISHILSQWDANHAPKIMATTKNGYKRIFGWETDSMGAEYQNFIELFFTAFNKHIQNKPLKDRLVYHIVDEPNLAQIEQYKTYRAILEKTLGDVIIMDAMSDFELYKQNMVKNPVPSNDNVHAFIDAEVPNLWTYYCCGQHVDVSNRFFAMPSARNRIIGVQMYKYNIVGFLHWGLNHYTSNQARKKLNPYLVTDGDKAYQAGDAFCIYPTDDGATESLRMVVFNEALQDFRALKLLESIKGREFVLNLIDDGLEQPITFSKYPKGNDYILNLRTKVNQILNQN